MVYDFYLESLFERLSKADPERIRQLRHSYRRIEHGLLPVGLKLHILKEPRIAAFFEKFLKESTPPKEYHNEYRQKGAVACVVFPPVGSASAAIALLEVLEAAIGTNVLSNPQLQIQVCSPGRLSPQSAAILTIAKYLASDWIRSYDISFLETTFSRVLPMHYPAERWGPRLVLYDASGQFDDRFHWWDHQKGGIVLQTRLPMEKGRTDVLDAGTREDIKNVNLFATCLVHQEYSGYWHFLGARLHEEIYALLRRHQLQGILKTSWVTNGTPEAANEESYMSALQELTAYAISEQHRLRHDGRHTGILKEMQQLLERYRSAVLQYA